MSFYLALVSPLDSPLYELSFPSSKPAQASSSSSSASAFPSWSTFTGANGSDLSLSPDRPGFLSAATPGAAGQGSASAGLGGLNGAGSGVGAGAGAGGGQGAGLGDRHLLQMIAHASLDAVEEVREGTGSLYLRAVDRHNEWTVSAFIATNVKFILLHDTKNDDGIRLFFGELWEHYVKTALSPFHTPNTPIRSPAFEAKVRASAKRHL
ncbi:TRAPP subunit [Cryptotrichosporon argae]